MRISAMFTLNDLLDIAVKLEENGKRTYCQALDRIKNDELIDLLQWMADEEVAHGEWFSAQKQALEPDRGESSLMLPQVLQEMMGEKSLSLDEVKFSTITHSVQMLQVFIEFENDTILFYEFLQALIQDPKDLAGLKKIIQEELTHVAKLKEMIQAIENPSPKKK